MTCSICGHTYEVTETKEHSTIEICPRCCEDNISTLFVKCKSCKAVTIVHRNEKDRLSFIQNMFYGNLSKIEDLIFTGYGFLIKSESCPQCREKEVKTFKSIH